MFAVQRLISNRKELIHIFGLTMLTAFEYTLAAVVVGEGERIAGVAYFLDAVFVIPGDVAFWPLTVEFQPVWLPLAS